jgi:Cof subfamily protein (haloacid dehalogenase superfamily)
MPKIKAVFTDIDNTLTDPLTHQIPLSAIQAIQLARRNGTKVFAATGRNLTATGAGPVANMEFDGYVTVNGQYCYLPDGTTLRFAPFKREWVEESIRLGLEHGFFASYHQPDRISINGFNDGVQKFYDSFNSSVPSFLPNEEIDKDQILSIIPFVREEMDDFLRQALPECQAVRWNPHSVDLAPKSGGKDVGLQIVLSHFGISVEECLAIGDGGNDVTMLKMAGIGVAVGGARQETKAVADFIAPEVADDAIFKTFKKFGII